MPKESKPDKPERQPKTQAELHEEEVQKQLTRLHAGQDERLKDAQLKDELAKQHRRERVQRRIAEERVGRKPSLPGQTSHQPFSALLRQANVQVGEKQSSATQTSNAERNNNDTQARARRDTLEIAQGAAEALPSDPNVAIIINTGSSQTQKIIGQKTFRRKVMRAGHEENQLITKRKYFGKENTDHHSTLSYGWEIPIPRQFSEPGARTVLCEDGSIMTLRAHEKPVSALDSLDFSTGTPVDNKVFLSPKEDGQPDKILLIADRLGYSELTEDQSSDMATRPLPINNPEGASLMAMRREMAIQRGIAELLASNNVDW